jgi:hypothetical protein
MQDKRRSSLGLAYCTLHWIVAWCEMGSNTRSRRSLGVVTSEEDRVSEGEGEDETTIIS